MKPIVEAHDVFLSFGQTPALRGAALAVEPGEIIAVMGPSGSGKSTLLHCLAGIIVPDQGEVWFNGGRIDTLSETERSALRRERFGFVFQFGQLVPELTAEENVALPLLLGGVRRGPAIATAQTWFERLDLGGLEKRRSGELSGGQAQRVALARGLVAQPRVLFADEPTGSLDSLTGEQVMDLLVAAAREQGTTVVLVTHEPRVAAYADREVIVRDGKVLSPSQDHGMIRFGLRLAVTGGKEAAARLVIIAAAVAIGVGLLLTTLAAVNGVKAQNNRYAWLNTSAIHGPATSNDPLWWKIRGDYFHRQTIGRVDLAATGPHSPVPPGLPRLPRAGEYFASPALAELLRTTPSDQLADRFPGHLVGTIGPEGLPSPTTLIVVIGHSTTEMASMDDAKLVDHILTISPTDCGDCYVGIRADGMNLILGVVATALLFPMLMFIGTATRLSATRREQRFAAMRLVGATPRQITMISVVESTVSAVAGTAVGFGLFYACRPAVASIPFTGARFFPADLTLGPAAILAVALGVPVAAAIAARLALRRVTVSPLGVSRRVTPKPPRAYRLIPLALGIGELAYFVGRRPESTMGQLQAFLSGFLITMVGLVVAGPWLTMVGARLMARRTSRPATLIAARRLADNPKAGFRSVSGLVLALFVTSAAIGVMGTIAAERGVATTSVQARTLFDVFYPHLDAQSDPVPAGLTSVNGVTAVTVVRAAPQSLLSPGGHGPRPSSLALCADLTRTPDFGRCVDGAEVGWVFVDLTGPDGTPQVWPAAKVTAASLAALPIESVVIGTDGDPATVERARTAMESSNNLPRYPATEAEWNADTTTVLNQWQQLANVVILVSLVIAGCSLAVSVAGGVNDRKRPFSLLRLTGVPLRSLRDVVALESATPLLAAALVAIGTGFLAAHLFLTAQMQYAVRPPGPAYYVIVVVGIAASLGAIAATLPLLGRITGPETARNE